MPNEASPINGAYVRQRRKELHMTMEELGGIIGRSEQAISQYERGTRSMNEQVSKRISDALGITCEEERERPTRAMSRALPTGIAAKVRKGLECCKPIWNGNHWATCNRECPYFTGSILCRAYLNEDALVYIQQLETTAPERDIAEADENEIVHCKDCKYWGAAGTLCGETEHIKACKWAGWMVGENGYCVYGERKDEDAQID